VPAKPRASGDGGVGYCPTRASGAAFCDDFDHGTLGATWDHVPSTPPGTARLDLTTFSTAPAALVITTDALADAELTTLLFRKTANGAASRAVLGFDLFADDAQASGTLAIATLDLAIDHLLTLYLLDDDPISPGATLTEAPPGGTASVRNPLTKAPTAGKWTRVEIDVDARDGKAVVRFDGAAVLTAPIAKAAALDPTVRVGALATGPATPYTLRFDDVTLDMTP
jgi:hypothetical protein